MSDYQDLKILSLDEQCKRLNEKNDLLDEQIQILKEALEKISSTDTATDYDFTWLHLWRSKAKDIAQQALKQIEEMSNED